jgi:5'-3' exonuclease
VIDGDSFAHRAYHALPKTIRRSDGKSAGAIVGFANFMLRLYADERPRAVIVGWDTLEAPTKRHEMFPAYQSGREFDDDLIEQLKRSCRNLSPRLGLRTPKPQGTRRTTFSPPQFLMRSVQAALHWWRAAIGIPFSSPRRARRSSIRRGAGK